MTKKNVEQIDTIQEAGYFTDRYDQVSQIFFGVVELFFF